MRCGLGIFAVLAMGVAGWAGAAVNSAPFVGGKEGYACYRAPAVVVSAKGTVLAFAEGRVNDFRDEGDIDVVLKRSTDGGRIWGPIQVLANDGKNPCKNACPVVLPSGRIMAVYLWNRSIASEKQRTTRDVYVIHSDDDGVTWSKPRNITPSVYRETWGWYGAGPCHAIVKRAEPNKGRIIVPARHNARGMNMVSHVIWSDDGGETWHLGGDVPRQKTTESTVVELSDGSLLMSSRNGRVDENWRMMALSRDGGSTFAEVWPDKVLTEPGNGCQGSLLFHSMNPRTGKGNILFSNPANRETRSEGTIRLSEDDGRTWTKAYRYADRPAPWFTGYSDMAMIDGTDIALLYERGDYRAEDGKQSRYDEIGFKVVRFEWIVER